MPSAESVPDYLNPDVPVDTDLELRTIRMQLDAIQQQLTWLVTTVHGLVSVAQSNPMMRMMMNRAQK